MLTNTPCQRLEVGEEPGSFLTCLRSILGHPHYPTPCHILKLKRSKLNLKLIQHFLCSVPFTKFRMEERSM